jgi:RimJ/RimL family protein N-acetyltransferase
MPTDRLRTARLVLRPMPAAAAAALPHDRSTAAGLIGAILPPEWPQADLLDVLPSQAAAGPELESYGVWLMVEGDTNTVVGDVGFMGPPAAGTVEIGFSIIPGRRRRGYATEAARALAEWALTEPDVQAVIARCDEGNVASIAVLERVGFVRTGRSDGVIHWRLEPGKPATEP